MQPRRLTAIDGALALIAILVVAQMWVLTAALDAALGGDDDVALPAFVLSALLCLGSGLLYRFIHRLDRDQRRR
jgi:predicted membrane channel-forming protein YqfA (hemolysin III family)